MKSRKGCVIGTSLYNDKYGKSALKLSAATREAVADAGPASKARAMVDEAEKTGKISDEIEKTGQAVSEANKDAKEKMNIK